MPVATLKYPRTLTTKGKMFKKGVSEVISDAVAYELANDVRFEIKGLPGDASEDRARLAAGVSSGRPHVKAVRLEQIRNASATLDPDITENYEVNGLPSIVGLAKAMGWTPDDAEIREAHRWKGSRRGAGTIGADGDAASVADRPVPTIAVSETSARIINEQAIPDDAAEAHVDLAQLQNEPASTKPPSNLKVKVAVKKPVEEKPASFDD